MDTSNLLPQTLSPTAYQIGQYGRTPVSYFHGLPQISVPLTEVRGRGITIPVSLSYHGGGIKAEQHPGWVGLGWSLQAGGCITRVVNGIKDEMSASEYGHLHNTYPSTDPGYLHHSSDIQDGPEWTRADLYDRFRSGFSEYEPDEYILSAPGISCSFILVNNHQLKVISRDGSPISLEEVHTSYDAGSESLDVYPGQVTGNTNGPVAELMKSETLTEVHYPTGGWTEYLWEPHSYGMSVLPPEFIPDASDIGTAGGLRIASVIDHISDGSVSTRTYSYSDGDSCSGILCARATCETSGAYTIDANGMDYGGHFAMYSEQPILPLSETDGCHVTYSCVRETFADGGYAEYRFSNHDAAGYRDHTPVVPPITSSEVSPLYPRFTSRALQRGLMLRKDVFRADGALMSSEVMSYADSSAQTYRTASLDRYVGGNLVFLSYSLEPCGYPALTSRTVTEYDDDGISVSDLHTYTYNSHRLPVSETVRRGSVSEGTMTVYTSDRSGGVYAQMVSEGFTGLPVSELKIRDLHVIEAREISYKDMQIPSFDGSRRTWRPAKQWSGRFASPVAPGTYSMSPMSYMQASPDVEVKLFDDTAAPLFAGMKDGSATEFHWSPRHGQPGMVLRTKDMDFQDDLVREQHDMVLGRQLIAEGTFRTTRASTFSCYLSPEYGYAFYVAVVVDGVNHYMVYWSGDGMPDEHWMDLLDRYDGAVSVNLGEGEHSFRISHLEWRGPGGPFGTTGGYVSLNYCQARDSGSAGKFLSLDEDSGTAEGFHCAHGHSGPHAVSHDILPGRNYVLDYMERQTDGEWHYMRTAYSGGNVTIGGTGRTVSNVRIYPEGSMPESYSYRDFVGMSAKTDARGVSESYGYDGLGRLSEVHDNDGILGKELSYLFATAGGGTGADNSVRTTEYNYGNTGNAIAKTTVSHLDGLGRPVQETIVGGGGDGGDIITRKEYDLVGRELRNLVPTPSSAFDPSATERWTENEYEASPRDRILSVTGPGQAWRDAGKKVPTEMFTNGSAAGPAELRHQGFTVALTQTGMVLNRNASLTSQGMHNVTKTTSEDEDVTLVFKDMHGDEVLTRRVLTDSVTGDVTYVDTHTVRDAFGRVAAVISPKLTKQLETSGISQWSWGSIENLAFLYRYDSRGNCIAKNIPGGGWTYMAYDKGGRCVFTQDAVQREQGRWAFRLVDLLGRECVTGTVVRDMGFQSDPIASTNIYVSLPSSPDYSGTLKGYALSGLSSLGTDPRILTVSYYDGYGFNAGDSVLDYSAPSSSETYGRQSLLTATGLLTGRLVRVLDGTASETFLKDVMFYDDKGRVIQRCSTNIFGKVDREYIAYDFAGNVTKRKVEHGKPGTTSVFTETLTSTFDAMGRPLKTTHKAGTATSRTVMNRIYDSVGRLSSLSRINPPVAALTQTYSYNIRSWLTAIGGTLFREEIDYCTGNDPRWDGKISGIRWKNPSETAWRSFRYGYDGLSRLVSADYSGAETDMICSEEYDYDLNCNLLHRMSSAPGMFMPTLEERTYEGNRLEEDLTNGVSYDACGRYTGSSGSVVSTSYNEIGLPLEMTLSDCSVVRTVYAADGRKLRETTVLSGTSATRSYSGSCIFEGNTLKKVLFEGGYAQMSGSTPSYMFFLTDHLGSVRVVAAQNADVKQVNQYYPFGDLIAESRVTAGTSDNRYRFTGKEFGERTGLYDFSARYLEPSMGRFTTIDPLAEKYPSVSPYAYCAGDPVNKVDLDGRKIKGVTKDDAYRFRDDIYHVLSGDKFAGVRSLLDIKGRSFIKIDSSSLMSTINGISLTEDETAYVTMISNAINSNSTFIIEYVTGEFTSSEGANAFAAYMNKELGNNSGDKMLTPDGRLSSGWISNHGNGLNVPTLYGSHSFVIDNLSENERSVTSGHELLGHGFSAAKGITGDENHSNAIRTDNLIRRLLNLPQRDGHDHNGTVTKPYNMPLVK